MWIWDEIWFVSSLPLNLVRFSFVFEGFHISNSLDALIDFVLYFEIRVVNDGD